MAANGSEPVPFSKLKGMKGSRWAFDGVLCGHHSFRDGTDH